MWTLFSIFLLIIGCKAHPPSCNLIESNKIVCWKIFDTYKLNLNIKMIEINDLNNNFNINLNEILEFYPNLENFTISGGQIENFIEPSHDNNNPIRYLHMRHIGLSNLNDSFLDLFPNLEILDLRENHLQYLDSNLNWRRLKELYLYGNRWNCSKDLSWILDLSKKVTVSDLNALNCYQEPYGGKPLLKIAEITEKVKNQCPSDECYCWLPKVVRHPETGVLEPIIEVNCSNRNLKEFPNILPDNTKILHMENNEIENLSMLRNNPQYHSLLDLYLDNNKIVRIEELEGSYWLSHFRVLSLSGNRITELPTYALDNALEQNSNMPNALRMYLGRNPWRCDCVFTPVFQEMLRKFAGQIQDADQIKCSYVEGDDNSLLPIIDLSRSSVCRLPTESSIQILDVVNGILASLIILIIIKFSYDYYYYKVTGKLPAIATKIP